MSPLIPSFIVFQVLLGAELQPPSLWCGASGALFPQWDCAPGWPYKTERVHPSRDRVFCESQAEGQMFWKDPKHIVANRADIIHTDSHFYLDLLLCDLGWMRSTLTRLNDWFVCVCVTSDQSSREQRSIARKYQHVHIVQGVVVCVLSTLEQRIPEQTHTNMQQL